MSASNSGVSSSQDPDHLHGMDLLRGVAAVVVVWFHLSTRLDLPWLFAHGYLAVDFFFALSGFVVAKAYEGRLSERRLALPRFAVIRVVRLLPLIVLGTALASVIETWRPGVTDQHAHLVDTAWAVAMGVTLVPTLWGTTLELAVFPLNGPTWSLFFEIVANAVFALWARSGRSARWLCAFMATGLVALAIAAPGHADGGHGAVPSTFWLGFARVSWSFAAGVGMYRVRGHAPRLGILPPLAALVAVTAVPSLGRWDGLFDLTCMVLVLPWVVFASSTAALGPFGRRMAGWSGDLSYPIYAVHYPVVRALGVVGTRLHLPTAGRLAAAAVATLAVVAVSAAAYRAFDVPVRSWLSARVGTPRQKGRTAVA